MKPQWPVLSYQKGKATYDTLHMCTQIVGKIKLAVMPWVNHSWHITLHVTLTGLSTRTMYYNGRDFQIDFDFVDHRLIIKTGEGQEKHFRLHGISVAAFYKNIFEKLHELEIDVKIKPEPVEVEHPVPFEQDTLHATYDEEQARAFHAALLHVESVFTIFRARFKGKASPIHFFWGSFDLALSFFSGRRAPKHPGGVPGLPDQVAREAYCREVSSCGFWTGSDSLPEPAFYCYLYPEPDGYKTAKVQPAEAYYHKTLGEFILPYSVVQQAPDGAGILLSFLNSTYERGAELAKWDRHILEDSSPA